MLYPNFIKYQCNGTESRSLSTLIAKYDPSSINLSKISGFDEIDIIKPRDQIKKWPQYSVDPFTDMDQFVHMMISLLKSALIEGLSKYARNTKILFSLSGGADSRILLYIIRDMYRDMMWPYPTCILTTKPEVSIAAAALNEIELPFLHHIHRPTMEYNAEYYGYGKWKNHEGCIPYILDLWGDAMFHMGWNSNDVIIVNGTAGDAMFNAPIRFKKMAKPRGTHSLEEYDKCNAQSMQAYFALNFKNIINPFMSFKLIQYADTIPFTVDKFVDMNDVKMDIFRASILQHYGSKTTFHIGHKYNIVPSMETMAYIRDHYHSSTLFNRFKDTNMDIARAQPWLPGEWTKSMRAYTLATTYEEAVK